MVSGLKLRKIEPHIVKSRDMGQMKVYFGLLSVAVLVLVGLPYHIRIYSTTQATI